MAARCRRRMHESRARNVVRLECVRAAARAGIRLDQSADVMDIHDRRCHVRGVVHSWRTHPGPAWPSYLRRDRRHARRCRLRAVELYYVLDVSLSDIRRRRRARQRVRLRDAGTRCVEVVSRQARARRGPDGRRIRSGFGNLRTCRDIARGKRRMAKHISDSRRALFRDGHDRGRTPEEPTRRIPASRMDPAEDRSGRSAHHARLRAVGDGAHSDLLRPLGGVLSQGQPRD